LVSPKKCKLRKNKIISITKKIPYKTETNFVISMSLKTIKIIAMDKVEFKKYLNVKPTNSRKLETIGKGKF
jgi:hypothetical protein